MRQHVFVFAAALSSGLVGCVGPGSGVSEGRRPTKDAAPDAYVQDGSTEPPCTGNCGAIAFVSARDGNSEIYAINADGTGLARLTNDAAVDEEPAWSPDGQRIAFVSNRSGSNEIYVMNADGSNVVQRTFATSYTSSPAWSADGTKLVYSSLSDGSLNLWSVSPNAGGASPALFYATPGVDAYPAWSPDGSRIAFGSDWNAYDFVEDIFVINPDGSGFTGLTDNIFDQLNYTRPSWSPNSAKIALTFYKSLGGDEYVSNLAVMNADGTGLTTLVPCGNWPTWAKSSWSPDGQQIAFTSGPTNAREVAWINADGSASGVIVTNGWAPSWKP